MAIRQLITDQRTRSLGVLLLVAVACAIQASWGSGSDISSTNADVAGANAELFADTLLAVQDFHMDAGAWQFPGVAWTLSQAISKVLPEDADVAAADVAVSDTPAELDVRLLALLKSLASADRMQGEFQRYRLVTPELRIVAWTVVRAASEIPVAVQCCWPAHDGSWMIVDAKRIDSSGRPADLTCWNLPAECETIARRVSDSGQVQCRMVAMATAAATVPDLFAAQGWRVEEPPSTAGLTGLFRATSRDGAFEINVRDVPSGQGCTALVRRLQTR